MDNFNLNDLADPFVGSVRDALYHRVTEQGFALDDPEVEVLTAALTIILGHEKHGTAARNIY